MKVETVGMRGFMCHTKEVRVQLPAFGLVVVVGPNGTGKSSIPEAVANAFWGKSLRGGRGGWRRGEAGAVTAVTEHFEAERRCSKAGSKSLKWRERGADDHKYDTATKAQEALVDRIGSFERWRRTHVFSSADSAAFTGATDAERKALLEELLGISTFDAAEAAAAKDHAAVNAELSEARGIVVRAKDRFDRAGDEVKNMRAEPRLIAEPTEKGLSEADRDQLEDELREVNDEAERLGDEPDAKVNDEVHERLQLERNALALAKKDLDLVRAGKCPTCGKDVDAMSEDDVAAAVEQCEARHEKLLDEANAAKDAAAQANAAKRQKLRDLRDRAKKLRDEVFADQRVSLAWQAWEKQREGYEREKKAWDEEQARRKQEWVAAEEQLGDAEDAVRELELRSLHFKAVRQVLGLRGARVQVLAEALEGIEAVANVWLARFFGADVQLSLTATSEQASGKLVGKIGLRIFGLEDYSDFAEYPDLSGGQRRRVDAALLMALAEISSHASGQVGGTVFMDEVFDAIDAVGVEVVATELAEMAKKRCVVLITHNEELARSLPAIRRIDTGKGGGFAQA